MGDEWEECQDNVYLMAGGKEKRMCARVRLACLLTMRVSKD